MLYIIFSLIALAVFLLDMLSKHLAVAKTIDKVIIPAFLKFKLAYNTGAACSFLGNKSWAIYFFAVLTILVLVFILSFMALWLYKKKKPSKWLGVALALVFGGGLGNLVDRLWLGKVRDFIFVFYNTDVFPAIFNIADIALVVGVIMICAYTLFIDSDAVFKFKKKEEKGDGNKENNP